MKKILSAIFAVFLATTGFSQPTPVQPRPSSVAQVLAGTDNTTYITPFLLATYGGGGGNYNPGAVAITGGSIGSGVNLTANNYFGVDTHYGNFAFVPSPMAALVVDVTKEMNTVTITAGTPGYPNVALTFSAIPLILDQEFGCRILNNTSTAVVITEAVTPWSYNKGALSNTFTIQPNSYVRLKWDYDGTNYYISGDPTSVAYRSLTWVVDNGSSVLSATTLHRLNSIPSGSTIVGWEVFCYPSGSVSFDIFKAATGTTPSVSITGSVQPGVASGTQSGFSSSLTGWTTAVTANDVFDAAILSATTSTNASVMVFYAPTL